MGTGVATPGDLASCRRELAAALPADALLADPADLRTYECDGLTGFRVQPALVVLPRSTSEVAACVAACHRHRIPFVARGAGTGLSGGALPVADGVVIGLARMRDVLEIDSANARMRVQPGVTNAEISTHAAPLGLYYAPDPSSQVVCTIGGNVAENSGGAHCLKYGFTVNHVLAVTMVTADGTILEFGDDCADRIGPDLLALIVGSEGTLGIVTEVTVRLLPKPAAVRTLVADFAAVAQAADTVSEIIAAGIVPAAVEMMDKLAIAAVEKGVRAGLSTRAEAILIIEVDGFAGQCDEDFAAIREICAAHGATAVHIPADAAERALIWQGRKAAFASMGQISPDYFVQDGVIPRTKLTPVLDRIAEMAREADLAVANVFHAGDGNLHPLVLYDARIPDQAERAEQLSTAIAELCVDAGGSLSGEHGIGTDKACSMPRMFSEIDLAAMDRVRAAFDPDGLCNPGKVLPTPRLCGERPGPYRPHPIETAGLAGRG
ncbi:glycolate oxidase [Naumannella cuiyingiana]|uniref:Glycolate oxidase n=1 Tax=Naumannella cuiyingiana TaxID=1347891 RepID=A0A7Z0IKL4_9ACTN|nr:FAD-linked oxidase C-terminal domain-containing protein [Naumannella cuiyingiana]NYI70656.1 glycolate oxidase [Naumannella cuiyingiana]